MKSGSRHGVADPAEFVPGKGWVRTCKCGRVFMSRDNWQHVPALYDHLAIAESQDRRIESLVAVRC